MIFKKKKRKNIVSPYLLWAKKPAISTNLRGGYFVYVLYEGLL